MTQFPPTPTHATHTELAAALRDAWVTMFPDPPSRAALLVLLAQWALETDDGRRCIAWNIGNVKSVVGDGRDFTEFQTFEYVNGVKTPMVCRFRAFASLEAGALDYLHTLSRRFSASWPFVLAGDPAGFAKALHGEHYYTASVESYTAGVVSRFAAFDAQLPKADEPVASADNPPIFAAPPPPDA